MGRCRYHGFVQIVSARCVSQQVSCCRWTCLNRGAAVALCTFCSAAYMDSFWGQIWELGNGNWAMGTGNWELQWMVDGAWRMADGELPARDGTGQGYCLRQQRPAIAGLVSSAWLPCSRLVPSSSTPGRDC